LTDERLEHIELDHPEMSGQIDKIADTFGEMLFGAKEV